jgi:hypothetical protein
MNINLKHFLTFTMLSMVPIISYGASNLTLEKPVLDPLSLAENAEATLLIEGAGNLNTKLIMLDGESLQGDSSGIASKCDLASNDAIRNLHGQGKKVKKKYKSVKAFTKRHKSESVWIVAKVEVLEGDIDFFCIFSSKNNSLYSPLLADAEGLYLKKFNKANKEVELALNEGKFKSTFVNENISEFKFIEAPKDIPVKGKFETSKEFAERVGILPAGKRNSYKYGKISKANPSYNADTQIASFSQLDDWHPPYEKGYRKGVALVNIRLEGNVRLNSFNGSNSFGASRSVTKESGKKLYARAPYPYLFWRSGLPRHFGSYEKVKIPIEIAKENLENTAYNVEISIESDSTIYDSDYKEATYSSPRARDIKYYTYSGIVTSVQLGNTKTGELYLSHQPRKHKEQLIFVKDPRSCKKDRYSYAHRNHGWTFAGPTYIRTRSQSASYRDSENIVDRCYKYFSSESHALIPFGVTSLLPSGSDIYRKSERMGGEVYSAYRFEVL